MSVGIMFLEQLYPWREQELQAALDQHPSEEEIVWVQEEPANMGAYTYVMPKLRPMLGNRALRSVRRHASASPLHQGEDPHQSRPRVKNEAGAPEGSRSEQGQNYAVTFRRITPTTAKSPVPKSARDSGSGVAVVLSEKVTLFPPLVGPPCVVRSNVPV